MHKNTVRAEVGFAMVVIGFLIMLIGFLVIALAPGLAYAETDQNPAWPCSAASTHGILHCDTPDTAAPAPATTPATPAPEPKLPPASIVESTCAEFDVRECLAESACSFSAMWCKRQAQKCRDLKTKQTTTSPQKRFTPDCTRLVHENHPDCRP